MPLPRLKAIVPAVVLSVAGMYEWSVTKSPSNYQVAATKLGFQTPAQQNAVLSMFNMAGYFKHKALWEQLYRSKIHADPAPVFKEMTKLMDEAGAGAKPENFNPQHVADNLFGKSRPHLWELLDRKSFVEVDASKMVLYWGQTAFDRQKNQERSELNKHAWMEESKRQYLEEARKIGLIDSIPPAKIPYQETLILGASRPGLYARLVQLNQYIHQGDLESGKISVLAGGRELWAQIDGISPDVLVRLVEAKEQGRSMDEVDVTLSAAPPQDRVQEGRDYLIRLATKLRVPFDKAKPIVIKNGRDYLNGERSVTETDCAQDLLEEFNFKVSVLDTNAYSDGARPDTASTARDKAREFVDKVVAGEFGDISNFDILSVSNNPYILRQARAVQRAFNEELKSRGLESKYTIKIYGAGFGNKQDVATVNSEFGADLSERFTDAYPGIDKKNLSFSTRDNTSEVPEMPLVGAIGEE